MIQSRSVVRLRSAWCLLTLCTLAWCADRHWSVCVAQEPDSPQAAPAEPTLLASGLTNPESVCYGPNGLLYVSQIGQFGVAGDGQISILEAGQVRTFATGLNDPKGMAYYQNALYVTDVDQVIRVDAEGKTSVYLARDAFPRVPGFLNDIAVNVAQGLFLISDTHTPDQQPGALFAVEEKTRTVRVIASTETIPELKNPNGVCFDGESFCLLGDYETGSLYRINLHTTVATQIASDLKGFDGLTWDHFGRLFITSHSQGKTFVIGQPGQTPVLLHEGMKSSADCCLDQTGRRLIVPDMLAGTVRSLAAVVPGQPVDDTPLDIDLEVAFPKLTWTGWDDGVDSGTPTPLRPIVLTHAGDGSGRVFVATQQGVIHVFNNTDQEQSTQVLLDLTDRVRYDDRKNEEGLLGLAFHPRFAETGELFVFYTDQHDDLANVVSRFRVQPGNKLVADPESEVELLRIRKPYWNHDGGALAFGPDGFLYITHGDGGAGNDPHDNGQYLGTWLGKVLRIDVDHQSDGKNYAIPADNPFVGTVGALPEIYAYGLRNLWRMAFDPQTGLLWGGDVGQNLYEEVVLLRSGGNYGWSVREGSHPFGKQGSGPTADLIEPVWEYSHDLGKSITGGVVYRGAKVPALSGAYLYSDYVSMKFWALRYDQAAQRVVANQLLSAGEVPALSFGSDEQGEAYVLRVAPDGKGILRFHATEK